MVQTEEPIVLSVKKMQILQLFKNMSRMDRFWGVLIVMLHVNQQLCSLGKVYQLNSSRQLSQKSL